MHKSWTSFALHVGTEMNNSKFSACRAVLGLHCLYFDVQNRGLSTAQFLTCPRWFQYPKQSPVQVTNSKKFLIRSWSWCLHYSKLSYFASRIVTLAFSASFCRENVSTRVLQLHPPLRNPAQCALCKLFHAFFPWMSIISDPPEGLLINQNELCDELEISHLIFQLICASDMSLKVIFSKPNFVVIDLIFEQSHDSFSHLSKHPERQSYPLIFFVIFLKHVRSIASCSICTSTL